MSRKTPPHRAATPPSLRLDRRTALKRGAALGLSVPALARLAETGGASPAPATHATGFTAQDTVLQFFHDKDPWQDFFIEMSDLATEAIGIGFEPTPYSDTTSYQQVVN